MQQGDLFGSTLGFSSKSSHPRNDFLSRYRLSFRLDQVMIGLIVLLCLCVFIFSLGVEKGKRYAAQEIVAERQKRETVMEELRARMIADQLKQTQLVSGKSIASAASETPKSQEPEKGSAVPSETKAAADSGSGVSRPGNFTIQIVTYKTESAALRQIHKFESKGYKSFVIPSGKYQQVCLEAFESKHQAVKTLKQLKIQGVVPSDAYVRPIPQ